MHVCDTCGDAEFECESGLYFCSTCNTQSQQFVQEEDEFVGCGPGEKLKVVRMPKTVGQSGAAKQKLEPGRPWLTVEGFTVVLREQRKSLEKLGLDSAVSDLLFKLWVLYQRKTKLGFLETSSAAVDSETASETASCNIPGTKGFRRRVILGSRRVRDRLMGTLSQPIIPNFRSKTTYQKYRFSTHSEQLHAGLVSAFGHEEFYEEDNPLFKPAEEFHMEDVAADMEDLQVARGEMILGRPQGAHIEQMDMLTTVALWYLALFLSRGVAVPADLVSLIKKYHLPFRGNCNFPADMKMMDYDFNVFIKGNIPSLEKLHYKTTNLISFLELHPLPSLDIKPLIARFIMELNLPGELYSFAADLHSIQPLTLEICKIKSIIPNNAAMSMAYIIIIIKLIFGLNENVHRKQQEFARSIQCILEHQIDIKLFVYKDWIKHQARRLSNASIPSQHMEQWQCVAQDTDVDDLISQYSTASYEGFSLKLDKCKYEPQKKHNDISQLFGQLHEKVATKSRSEDTKSVDISDEDFTPYSILYLTNWDKFVDTINTGGVSEYTLWNAGLDDSNSTPAQLRVKKSFLQRSATENRHLTELKEQLRELSPEGTDASTIYPVQATDRLDQWSSLSNRWLLTIAVSHIGGAVEEIQKYINILEMMHLHKKCTLNLSKRERQIRKEYVST